MMFPVFCVLIVILTTYIFTQNFYKIKTYVKWWQQINKLPELPGKKFFIGHAGYVIGKANEDSWKMARKWFKTAPPLHTVYVGPLFIVTGLLEADEIEAVISSSKNLQKADQYNFVRKWLEDGLLTSTGRQWQTRRKILTPAFHFSILQGFLEIFKRETLNMIKEIEEKCVNKSVDLTKIMSTFTLLTINETSMGKQLDINGREEVSYKNAINGMGEILYKRMTIPWFQFEFIFNMTSVRKDEKKLVKILHNFANNVIQKRAENFKVFEESINDENNLDSKRKKRPLLDILLNAKFKDNSIDDKGIREEVNTFMFAGHETTALTLMYTCMLLACNQDIQDELYQEIIQILGTDLSKEPTHSDLQNMTLMERCIKETLRLYPVVSIIGRKLDSDVQTKYGVIPKDTTCFIHLYDLHRNEKYWENPDKFDPSRHLPENSQNRHPFAYIPFSAGPRNCIGQRFAMLELKTAICGLMRKFILEPVDTPDTLILTQDMVLRPKNGVKVKFVLRT